MNLNEKVAYSKKRDLITHSYPLFNPQSSISSTPCILKSMPEELNHVVRHLKLEALSLAILMLALTYVADAPLWLPFAAFPVFDIGMLGYLSNPRHGSLTYNVMHNATIPTLCIVFGVLANVSMVAIIGYIWTFHIAVDRTLGFGLKYKTSFYRTHLGEIAAKGVISLKSAPSTTTTAVQLPPAGAPTQQYSSSPRFPSEPPR